MLSFSLHSHFNKLIKWMKCKRSRINVKLKLKKIKELWQQISLQGKVHIQTHTHTLVIYKLQRYIYPERAFICVTEWIKATNRIEKELKIRKLFSNCCAIHIMSFSVKMNSTHKRINDIIYEWHSCTMYKSLYNILHAHAAI